MPEVAILPVVVAAVAAFALSSTYYVVFTERLAELSDAYAGGGQPPPQKLAIEGARCVVLAAVVAGLAVQGEIDEWTGGLLLGLALWIGFPVVLWVGAVLWERTPPALAAIHAGDWLAKLLLVAVIVSVWQ
jgi:hypothetical protein